MSVFAGEVARYTGAHLERTRSALIPRGELSNTVSTRVDGPKLAAEKLKNILLLLDAVGYRSKDQVSSFFRAASSALRALLARAARACYPFFH